ncbi:MAG: pyridoxamine 5'-phosphate oxidase family protein [Spirochaetia bacterium]
MTEAAMYSNLERINETSKVAVLTTVDKKGEPRMRWMTPALLKGRRGAVYAVTSPGFAKAREAEENEKVQWMFQSKSLDEVMNLDGIIRVIDNPSIKSEVLEAIGGNLRVFWKINESESELVVLETVIHAMTYFKPMTGERTHVVLEAGKEASK